MGDAPSSLKLAVAPPVDPAPTIITALTAAKKAVGAVAKSQRNTVQNFNFRGVDAVVNAAAPALNDAGIVIIPEVLESTYETVEIGAKRTPMAHAVLKVAYWFYGPGGDFLRATVLAESMDSGDKAVAKAMSVAFRTALLQVLNLPTDEADPDEKIYERSSREETPRTSRASSQAAPAGAQSAQELADLAHKATTPEQVRAHYTTAGSQGWLKSEIAHPVTAEKVPLEGWLTERGNELKHSKSGSTAGVSAGSDGAKR